ncbi:MAG: thiamine diphosphokinase [Candidatus Levybacteria bacterium]|nr:thiamine diphosphokinase [Candidatus Levybacteria bacterium]
MTTTIAIIANGEIRNPIILKKLLSSYSKIIAADGGANNCRILDIEPDIIVGDLDSITPDTSQFFIHVPRKQYPCDKDHTDLELALKEAEGADKIALFCATGSRVDHSLTNLYILSQYPQRLMIVTEEETVFAVDRSVIVETLPGKTISLIPIGGSVKGVFTKGLKWELDNATLNNHFVSISNVSLGEQVTIELASGILLCCLHR